MITFQGLGFIEHSAKTKRSLYYCDIMKSGEMIHWAMYIPDDSDPLTYMTANANVYEQEIIRKEAVWATVPHTEERTDQEGNPYTYNIPKSTVVKPTLPDYIELCTDTDADIASIKRLLMILSEAVYSSPTITQQHIDDLTVITDFWVVGKAYKIGDKVDFEGKLFKVIQVHTSQADWLPNTVPALYSAFTPAGTILPWKQPIGSTDAYAVGIKVTHNGLTWLNTTPANVWEPGVYGWTQIP